MTTPSQAAKPPAQPQPAQPRVQTTATTPAPRPSAQAQAQPQSTRGPSKPTPVLESESYSDDENDNDKEYECKFEPGSEGGSDTDIEVGINSDGDGSKGASSGSDNEDDLEDEDADAEMEAEEIDDDDDDTPAAGKSKNAAHAPKGKPRAPAAPRKGGVTPTRVVSTSQPGKKKKTADIYKAARERMGYCFAAHMKSRFGVTNGRELLGFLESRLANDVQRALATRLISRLRENVSIASSNVSTVACMLSEVKNPGKDLWGLFSLTDFVPCYTQAHDVPMDELQRAKSSALDFLMINSIAAGKVCFRTFSQDEEKVRQMKSFAWDYALLDLISCMHPERMIKANHVIMIMLDHELHETERSSFVSYKPGQRLAPLNACLAKNNVNMANPVPVRAALQSGAENSRPSSPAQVQVPVPAAGQKRKRKALETVDSNSDSSGEEEAADEDGADGARGCSGGAHRVLKRAHTDSPVNSSLQYFSNMHMIMVADMELQKVEQRIAWLESETGAQKATRALLQERVKALRSSCTPQDAWEQLHAHATAANPFANY